MHVSFLGHFFRSALTMLTVGLFALALALPSINHAADVTVSDSTPALIFDDTDTAGLEWQIGGNANELQVGDLLNLKIPFRIITNAPTNSLVVSGGGFVGMGTSTPIYTLHIVDNTSALGINLQRTNPPAQWTLSHFVNGFSIRNTIPNSDTFPFGVANGASTNALFINATGKIGLGTAAPQGNLHIFGDATKDIFNGMGPDLTNGPAFNFGYSGASFGAGTGFFNVRGANSGVNPSLRFATVDQQRMIITNAGRVGIGTLSPTQLLDVAGSVRASSFVAGGTTLNVPDYVFEPGYQLRPLTELQTYIMAEKHLPDIPSAREIKEQGVNISELQMQLLKKIEELTLYSIQQNEALAKQRHNLTSLQEQNQHLAAENAHLRERLTTLETLVKDLGQR